jgi:hypothetical protein
MHMLSAMSACDSSSEIHSGGSVSAPPHLLIHPVGDQRRQEVESFIRDIYADRYGADVQQFAPVLASLRDSSGIYAAAGYRSALGSFVSSATRCTDRVAWLRRAPPAPSHRQSGTRRQPGRRAATRSDAGSTPRVDEL